MTPPIVLWPRASAVSIVFAYRLAGAFLVAYPAARTLGAFGPMSSPEADQALFEPGGYHLIEALRLAGRAVPAAVESWALVLVAVGIAGLAPLALAGVTLAHPETSLADRIARAAALFPRLLVLGGATLLTRAVVALVGTFGVGVASALGEGGSDERLPALLGAMALIPPLVAWLLLGLLHDFARAGVIRRDADALDALAGALSTLKGRLVGAARFYLLLVLAGVLTVALAAWLAGALDVSRPGSGRVLAVFAVHQGAVLALVVLRVLWLDHTLTLTGGARDAVSAQALARSAD
jgi:hypothetical protein